MGDHEAAGLAVDNLFGLEGPEAGEARPVHGPVAGLRHGEEVRVARRRERADEVERRGAVEELVVALRALAGVEDQCEPLLGLPLCALEGAEAGDQLLHELGELGDVGLVPRVGRGDEGYGAVGGDHEPQADQAQVCPLLLGMATLRDRGPVIGAVYVGGEIGHVEHQPRQRDAELCHHVGDDAPLDLFQLLFGDEVHGVPEAPGVERRGGHLHPAVAGGRAPPLGELPLGAGVDDPVGHRQGDVGPDRSGSVTAALSHHLVDYLGDPHALEHRPDRRQVPEGEVAGAVRLPRPAPRQTGDDLLGRAEVALGDDPGLAAYPSGLDQVVIGPAALLLSYDRGHVLGNTPTGTPGQASDLGKRAGSGLFLQIPRGTRSGCWVS